MDKDSKPMIFKGGMLSIRVIKKYRIRFRIRLNSVLRDRIESIYCSRCLQKFWILAIRKFYNYKQLQENHYRYR